MERGFIVEQEWDIYGATTLEGKLSLPANSQAHIHMDWIFVHDSHALPSASSLVARLRQARLFKNA